MMFFSTVVTQSKGSFRALTSMCHKTQHVYSFRSAATKIYCLAWLWLMNMFDFPFPGGCRSGLVPADPHPGESYSFGLGRQRSPGPSQDRVGKDCRVRCTCHTAHPFLQTGEDNTNLANSHDKWFFSFLLVPLTASFVSDVLRVFVSRMSGLWSWSQPKSWANRSRPW